MRKYFVLIGLLVFFNLWSKEEPKYPVSAIPEDLKRDVYAVVREDKILYKISARNKASLYAKFVVTIFHSNGKRFATKTIGYDKLSKIKNFNGVVYDASGNLIKRVKNNEIVDNSAYDGFSLFSDNRIKSIDLAQSIYPYTVEFEYEMDYKFLYGIDGSLLIPDEKVSVQQASYQLIYPPQLKPRYKTLNITTTPKTESIDGFESLQWTFSNLKPVKFEMFGPDPHEILPQIIAAPSESEYDGYVGNMSSWETYGKWNLLLNKGREELLPTTKQKIKELTNALTTNEEKVRVLYEYLQSKTRYVSIQLGIGGLQPFPASVVDQTGYGDCKALSNYMVAMLKEVGIKGYYTTVRAGANEPSVMIDFPSHQSNHVIVAVPNGQDTLWLECTSQTNPFGYLGSFTGNRKALMITDEGGKLVNTACYSASQNTQIRKAQVKMESNGNALAKITTSYNGMQYENGGLAFAINNHYDDKKKWVQRNTQIASFDINTFSMKDIRSKIPSAIVNLDLTLNRYGTVSGKRLFLLPNLMNRSTFIPDRIEARKTNVIRKLAYTDIDTIQYVMPEEIYPEFLPEPIKLKTRFGEYESSFKIDKNNVIYTRKLRMEKGVFPPSAYNQLIEFYKNINKADNVKIVFLNKT